jgi:hypothetical protein
VARSDDIKVKVESADLLTSLWLTLSAIAEHGLIVEGPNGEAFKVRIANADETATERQVVPTRSW